MSTGWRNPPKGPRPSPEFRPSGLHILVRLSGSATRLTGKPKKARTRIKAAGIGARKDHISNPCPTSIASNETLFSVHFLPSLLLLTLGE